jgi:methyl-accepting chemotaxis protein
MMRSISIGTKISFIVIGILLAFSAVIAYEVIGQMQKGIKTFATEKAKSDLELVHRFIEHKYPGDWQIKDGLLYKGETKMNENFDLVDEIGQTTGDTVTVFQADKRVATNVMNQGKRAVGTTVSDKVGEVVLKKGEKYYGEAVVVGKTYQAAYEPIKNAKGEIIGIFYVGAPQQLIDVIISSFIRSFFIVFAAAIVISVAMIVWYMRRTKARLGNISKAMEHAGAGDFTAVVADRSRDEIGKLGGSFNHMRASLRELIQQGHRASDKVIAATKQILDITERATLQSKETVAAIEQMASGAASQTQSTAENLKAMEEVSAGIQRIAGNAAGIAESAVYSKRQAETGGQYVHQTVQQMAYIQKSVHDTDKVIKLLDGKSREIAGILEIIREISAQTNLLALNAAIEAARAGEHGRGFAIVASEVRKLAEQSGQSSDRIADLVKEIEADMQRSIEAMAQVIEEVRAGLQLAHEADRNFHQIVESNGRIAEQIEEMAATAEQMSAGIQQITASVTEIAQIAKITSTNSNQAAASTAEQLAAIEQIASSSASLSEVSDELQMSLGKFNI